MPKQRPLMERYRTQPRDQSVTQAQFSSFAPVAVTQASFDNLYADASQDTIDAIVNNASTDSFAAAAAAAVMSTGITFTDVSSLSTLSTGASVDDALGELRTLLNGNTSSITANTTAIDVNATAISANTASITANTTAIEVNTASITANTTAIEVNAASIALLLPAATGWSTATGTESKATFASFTAQSISTDPLQAEVQAIDDHVVVLSQRLAALVNGLFAAGVLST